LATQADIMPQT